MFTHSGIRYDYEHMDSEHDSTRRSPGPYRTHLVRDVAPHSRPEHISRGHLPRRAVFSQGQRFLRRQPHQRY